MSARFARAIPTPRCAHGVDFPETRCDPRWIAIEKRQIEAQQFQLDMMQNKLDRRVKALATKRAKRTKLGKATAKVVTVSRGNEGSTGTACVCGHAVEEGSTACSECPDGDCIAYESNTEGSAV